MNKYNLLIKMSFVCFSILCSNILFSQCDAGTLTTIGEVTVVDAESFDVEVINEIVPNGGGFAWFFSNTYTNGTGATGAPLLLTNVVTSTSYDNDLNGVLSANGLPPFEGTWVVFGTAHDDASNALNTLCSTTMDSLVVNFTSTPIQVDCNAGDLQTTGIVDVPDGSTFDLMVVNDTIPTAGGYGWVFSNDNTNGTGGTGSTIILTGAPTTISYDNDLNGVLSLNGLPPFEGSWVVYGTAYSDATNALNTRCSTTTDSLTVNFIAGPQQDSCYAGELETIGEIDLPSGDSFDLMVINDSIPSGGGFGWFFKNSNSNGTGALNSDFILTNTMTSESYDNDLNGILSTNGLSLLEGTWVLFGAVYTDPNNSFGSICHMTSDSLIVNFEEVVIECSSGDLQTFGEIVVCKLDTFVLETVNSMTPASGGLGWFISNLSTNGTGGLDEPIIITNVTEITTFDEDLSGILSANGLPVLEGTWVFYAAAYENSSSPFTSICDISSDSLTVTFSEELTLELNNDFNTSVSSTIMGGVAPYTYVWSNGESGDTAVDLSDGELSVIVTDSNGCTAAASIDLTNTSIEDISNLENFELYPNPTNGVLHIDLELSQSSMINIDLMDVLGHKINSYVNEYSSGNAYEIDLSNLQLGVYFIRIELDNEFFIRKVIKN